MNLRLRTIGRADLETLARIHARCFPEDAWEVAALAGVLAIAGAEARLAEDDGRPVGFLFASIVAEEAEILTFGVAPEARLQGIARALLADLYARAAALGANRVVLEVAADNSAALALYESEGFRTVGLRNGYYYRDRGPAIDAWLLRRMLV
ncbi:MAG TPA: ribosomal protein S18-alanine N-acetyltransferase [Stellaceae bacterium]|nr:ribosomal protein S18-alanine N-acetyltransferase [Stellaceae bacterium]